MTQYWLCYGKKDKWDAALSNSKWGVKELASNGALSSPAKDWEKVQVGDIAIFVLGSNLLHGYGVITGKSDQEEGRIWPDEQKKKKVIYNRRLDIKFIANCSEEKSALEATDVQAPNNAGLSPLIEETALLVISKMKKEWKIL